MYFDVIIISMPRLQNLEKRARGDLKAIQKAAKGRILGYLTAGFGFVAGLAWNEAITSLIDEVFPLARNTVLAKFLYAGILTLVVAIVAIYVERLLRNGEEKKQP